MKNYKYIGLLLLTVGFTSCDVNNELDEIAAPTETVVALDKNGLDFSKYVSIGASFTAGYTDGALFKAGQENSFPNILASKFGTDFKQPLMNDNTGGMIIPIPGIDDLAYRFIFNGKTPERVNEYLAGLGIPAPAVTTNAAVSLAADGSIFTNVGAPGAKSTHIDFNGYASLNPYFGRMANSASVSMLEYAIAQNPTFFTLSEIGGNDVLGYALSGGDGTNSITPTATFDFVFNDMVNQLTAVCPKGVITNVPYITNLPHFTTVPYNPLDPNDVDKGEALKTQIPLLNSVFAAVNSIYVAAGQSERSIVFSTTETNSVVIYDEDATDLTNAITTNLASSAAFATFVEQSLGLPKAAAPLVASLLGQQYGKARSATSDDLLVLPSSSIIGTVNTTHLGNLVTISGGSLSQTLAGQFSAEGITLPLADKWVLTPQEQLELKTATDSYNTTIASVASAKGLALVDFKGILEEASMGILFDDYTLTTSLVTGGLVSLDGIHLTSRGYALLANKVLAAIDATYNSNFTTATDGLAKAENYPTNYSPTLQ